MLLCVSASHKTASFELLERLSVHTDLIGPTIAAHDECVQGAVVVATCNRFEAYVDMDEPVTAAGAVGLEAALLAIEAATGVTPAELEGSYRVVSGDEVASHLFSVASGLESVVVGEGEIAGQVRRALTDARERGTSSPELERLFQQASATQRGVKNTTALTRAGRSLVRLALDLADSRIVDWAQLRVLLVGTGSYAAATIAALRDHGAADISVASPSGRQDMFAARHGLHAVAPGDYARAVAQADLVIACTSVETPVLSAATFAAGAQMVDAATGVPEALGAGLGIGLGLATTAVTSEPGAVSGPGLATTAATSLPERRLVIDLGLPRNVDPDVAGVAGAELLDLETIRVHAPLEELQATDDARQLVADAAARFAVVGERRSVTPAVVALRAHVTAVLDDEIARVRARGDDGSTEQALRHLAGVLLHTPTVRAHQLAEEGRGDDVFAAVAALFGLEVDDAPATGSASEGFGTAASAS